MIIYIGSDHGGFKMKELLKKWLMDKAYEVGDMGPAQYVEEDDYPDTAAAVARKVSQAEPGQARGILICRSGAGVDIVANKFRGVRSVLAISTDHIYQARHDDDVNVLSIAADFTDEAVVPKIVQIFLSTPFAKEGKYTRRLNKISEIENARE
jgi:ribose 5-phosphate isomerase B